MARLNKAGQEEARRKADGILRYSKNADEAKQAAYRIAMHALDGRDKRAQRIADEAQRLVESEATQYYVNKS